MQVLLENGLYGDGLIAVNTPEMVSRYNACLADMGLSTTTTQEFRIDGMGWSPELADEFGNEHYLQHGDENPLAIILTPAQRNAPIFRPPFSFIWDLMKLWLDSHKPQVRFVTTLTGIWLDFEQQLDVLQDREDLLMIDGVRVRARTPERLMVKAGVQRELVHNFMHEDDPAKLLQLAKELAQSSVEVGDLREQPVVIDDWQFSDVRTFYTRMCEGTFVIRPNGSDHSMLVDREEILAEHGVQSATEKRLLSKLTKEGFVSFDSSWWKDHLGRLQIVLESFVMDVLDEHDPDVDLVALNHVERKGLLHRHSKRLPSEYHTLKRFIRKVEQGVPVKKVDASIKAYVAHPADELEESAQEVIWHLLTLVCDLRQVVRLYRYDKDMFFEECEKWSPARLSWAIAAIKEHYQYRMMNR